MITPYVLLFGSVNSCLLKYRALRSGLACAHVQQVHERTVDSDFLIIILRDLVLQRKDLTLVLMSATLNADVSLDLLCVFSEQKCVSVSLFFLRL